MPFKLIDGNPNTALIYLLGTTGQNQYSFTLDLNEYYNVTAVEVKANGNIGIDCRTTDLITGQSFFILDNDLPNTKNSVSNNGPGATASCRYFNFMFYDNDWSGNNPINITEIIVYGFSDVNNVTSITGVFRSNNNATDLRLYTGSNEKLRINSSTGNVLIGKTSQTNSSFKLDVAGPMRANEVTVNTTGADFVFDKNYKLKPLSEVETFINTNKRLPDIAPATEMQTNGVSMGEMQAKLLQKVEELTLYSIEQNKKNTKLEQELIEQKAKYDALLRKVEALTELIEKDK